MSDIVFIENFVAEIALDFIFVTLMAGSIPPIHTKSQIKGFLGLIFLFPFYVGWVKLSSLFTFILLSLFIIYGIYIFIPMIIFKANKKALEEFQLNQKNQSMGLMIH